MVTPTRAAAMRARVIKPGDEDWKGMVPPDDREGKGSSKPDPIETAISASPDINHPITSSGAIRSYPLQLKVDITNYLYKVFVANGKRVMLPSDAPGIQRIVSAIVDDNPLAYAHARLLADTVGLEAFTIRNMSIKIIEQEDYRGQITQQYSFGSVLTTNMIRADAVKAYVLAMLGPEGLSSDLASDLRNAKPDERVYIDYLATLLANFPVANFLKEIFEKDVEMKGTPFNSPYLIVMQVEPLHTRELVSVALAAGYADGSIQIPHQQLFPETQDTYEVIGYSGRIPSSKFKTNLEQRVSVNKFEIPQNVLEMVAAARGITDTQPYQKAYSEAWKQLLDGIK